jgi:hypothetical protein
MGKKQPGQEKNFPRFRAKRAGMETDTQNQVSEDERKLYQAVKESPLFFFREILGAQLDEQQVGIVEAFPHARRLAIKSGHSCGKDWLSARLALWFHITHFPSIVVLTGPTDRQVRSVVWGEIKAAVRQARYPIGGEMLETQLKSGHPKHFMIGFTANSPEAFQGFHSDHVLVCVTEAPGVEPRMWPGIVSLLTAIGDARLLAIGNATYDPESEFYAMFTRSAEVYLPFTLDSERSSYCSKTWIEEMRKEHGVDSPVYQARVKGIFPTDIADTLIPLGWIERAYARWADAPADGPRTLGVDLARFGSDSTVHFLGEGVRFWCVDAVQGQDLMQSVGRTIKLARDHKVPDEAIRGDDTGLGGGWTDRLREQQHRITAINFGAKATDDEKFANARSEMFWALRERFREGEIAIDPSDTKLLRDLSVLKYKMTSKGQIKLEEKAEAKRRLGYSPDRADALALAAIAQPTAAQIAAGPRAGWGFLEIARTMNAERKEKSPEREIAGKRDVRDVPGATELLERAHAKPLDMVQADAARVQIRSLQSRNGGA